MNKEEIEIKSKEVIDILEKYREKLNLTKWYLSFHKNWKEKYELRIQFKCDYKRYDMEDIDEWVLSIRFDKEDNTDVILESWGYNKHKLVFNNTNKLKLLLKLIDELQKIEYIKLQEFLQYVDLLEEEEKLKKEKEEIEKKLLEQKEEIDKKINELNSK
jgi:hypothetical protein